MKLWKYAALALLLVACDEDGSSSDAGPGTDGMVAGDAGDVDAGDPGPCALVDCQLDAHCVPETGECVCDEGHGYVGGVCLELPPDDPALRTEVDVCDAWAMGHVEDAAAPWTPGGGGCDAGSMPMEAIDDTVRRVNLYRWLAGMPDVGYDGSAHEELMDCANMMSQNDSLSHDPPMSWTCWTSGGADAAGRSNIAWGYSSPGNAIDGYMTDVGTPSLGHRRWILGRRLGAVEVGFSTSGGRPGQCLGVFDRSGSAERRWTAYPNPGVAPIGMVSARRGVVTWSLQANDFDLPAATDVVVEEVGSDAMRPVDVYLTGGNGPPPSVGFTPQGWEPTPGTTYRVTVTGTEIGDIIYETTLVDCM